MKYMRFYNDIVLCLGLKNKNILLRILTQIYSRKVLAKIFSAKS